jgi:hypothetical protein
MSKRQAQQASDKKRGPLTVQQWNRLTRELDRLSLRVMRVRTTEHRLQSQGLGRA